MQQVGAKGFADAQLVDPRQLPVPIAQLSRRARINFSHAWILHRKLMLRLAAAGIVIVGIAGAYQAREPIGTAVANLYGIAQGEFARAGFGIDKINISGQSLTGEAAILRALGLDAGTSTVSFDADAALERVLAIPTVKTAAIRKKYPGELIVSIDEKVPLARWRIGDATYLVDEFGTAVAPDDGSFRELPLVVGEGAPDDAIAMVRTLERYPQITRDLAALSRIGDRRWDLIFYSGLRVKLPENGVAQALQQLAMYHSQHQLLDRDVNVIDMRVPGMVSLTLGELALKAREDAAKDKKKKPAAPVATAKPAPTPQTAPGAQAQ
ncbi:MAG TPA: cell division protein FtsQ/DivIB [Devosia sp.]|nr:cell division protein FtsQ/DivIB [Devosia sp.]